MAGTSTIVIALVSTVMVLQAPFSLPRGPQPDDGSRAGSRLGDQYESLWTDIESAIENDDENARLRAARQARTIYEARLARLNSGSFAHDETAMRLGVIHAILGSAEESQAAFALIAAAHRRSRDFASLRLVAANLLQDSRGVIEALEAFVAVEGSGSGSLVRELTDEQVAFLDIGLIGDEEAQGELAEILLAGGWRVDAAPGTRDWLYIRAMRRRFEQGDRAGATEALESVRSPQALMATFVERRFAPLWPEIEARHGSDLSRRSAEFQSAIDAAYRSDPSNLQILIAYHGHLAETGQYERALALVAPIADDMERIAAAGEDGYWAVNAAADTELALGRGDQALARMDRLIDLGVSENPALISMAINRVAMLFALDRHDEALTGAEELAALDERQPLASPYGQMWIWSTAACAAHELSRSETVARWREKLEASPDDNPAALMRTYLCIGELASAERLLIQRLEGDDPASMLLALQESTFDPPRTQRNQELQRLARTLLERPSVSAAIERVGRIGRFAYASAYWGQF